MTYSMPWLHGSGLQGMVARVPTGCSGVMLSAVLTPFGDASSASTTCPLLTGLSNVEQSAAGFDGALRVSNDQTQIVRETQVSETAFAARGPGRGYLHASLPRLRPAFTKMRLCFLRR